MWPILIVVICLTLILLFPLIKGQKFRKIKISTSFGMIEAEFEKADDAANITSLRKKVHT